MTQKLVNRSKKSQRAISFMRASMPARFILPGSILHFYDHQCYRGKTSEPIMKTDSSCDRVARDALEFGESAVGKEKGDESSADL